MKQTNVGDASDAKRRRRQRHQFVRQDNQLRGGRGGAQGDGHGPADSVSC